MKKTALLKTAVIILTLIYSLTMPLLSGCGLVFNAESYGGKLVFVGIMLIVSALLMTCGNFMCFSEKQTVRTISCIFTVLGTILCMVMLYILCDHADRAGWSNKFTMNPVSDMYKSRIFPCIVPSVSAAVIVLCKKTPE